MNYENLIMDKNVYGKLNEQNKFRVEGFVQGLEMVRSALTACDTEKGKEEEQHDLRKV